MFAASADSDWELAGLDLGKGTWKLRLPGRLSPALTSLLGQRRILKCSRSQSGTLSVFLLSPRPVLLPVPVTGAAFTLPITDKFVTHM